MSMSFSSHGSLKIRRWCALFKVLFIAFESLLVLLLLQVALTNEPGDVVKAYVTTSERREHFLNFVGSFSVFQPVDPTMASKTYLSTTTVSPADKKFLRYFIDDYISFHKQNRHNSTRRLIYTPIRTGIGDRMECLLYAYFAAVVSKRVFLVDWHRPFPLRDFLTEANGLEILLEEGEIDNEAKIGKVATLGNSETILGTYEETLSSGANTVIVVGHKLPRHFSEEWVGKQDIPYDMTPAYVNNGRLDRNFHRAVLHHVFMLSDRIRRDQETFSRQMGLSLESAAEMGRSETGTKWMMKRFPRTRRAYIAVHARLGTGVGEGMTGRFRNASENEEVIARCLASRAVRLAFLSGSPALPIYLATDTPRFRDTFEKAVTWCSNGRVDVLSGNWSVQHSNKLAANENKTLREANWEPMWGSYMDLVMLGHGQHILALYSSFPRFAAALGNAETITELKNQICFAL